MRDLWAVDCDENRGAELHFDRKIDKELKKEIKAFMRWIRKKYVFPVRLKICITNEYRITTYITHEKVCGTIFFPDSKHYNPIIRIATGDYKELVSKYGAFSAGCMILDAIAHEISHYFQWLKDKSCIFSEKQAGYKSKQEVNKYLDYCFEANRPEPFSKCRYQEE